MPIWELLLFSEFWEFCACSLIVVLSLQSFPSFYIGWFVAAFLWFFSWLLVFNELAWLEARSPHREYWRREFQQLEYVAKLKNASVCKGGGQVGVHKNCAAFAWYIATWPQRTPWPTPPQTNPRWELCTTSPWKNINLPPKQQEPQESRKRKNNRSHKALIGFQGKSISKRSNHCGSHANMSSSSKPDTSRFPSVGEMMETSIHNPQRSNSGKDYLRQAFLISQVATPPVPHPCHSLADVTYQEGSSNQGSQAVDINLRREACQRNTWCQPASITRWVLFGVIPFSLTFTKFHNHVHQFIIPSIQIWIASRLIGHDIIWRMTVERAGIQSITEIITAKRGIHNKISSQQLAYADESFLWAHPRPSTC